MITVRDHFRAYARRRVDLRALLKGREGAPQEVMIRDLGLGGACLEVGEIVMQSLALEREGAVSVEVTTPSLWDPLVVRGKIAWVRRGATGRPARVGMRFEHREAANVYGLFQLLGAHL